MSLEKVIEILNSEYIAGALKGATIKKFWVESIKGKKKMIRIHIQTDIRPKPLVSIPMIISTGEIRDYCDFKEYDLSIIKFDVRVLEKGYLV